MYHFCTYFDQHYLSRGLALYRSLKAHCSSFRLWVLCMDRACFDILSHLGLPGVETIALEDFERGDQELLGAKGNRSPVEYYFTCTPSLPLFILRNFPEVSVITYLDADLFFFADPKPVYEEIANHSIAIIEHRFSPPIRDSERYGIYNVGWVSFRRDQHALACLRWWRERCIEWCYDRLQDGKFADQKYLDDWPSRFKGVVTLRQKGANLAPWNLGNYRLRAQGNRVWVDEQPLLFFHFHGFKQITPWLYDPNLALYRVNPFRVPLRNIYGPYIRILLETMQQVLPYVQAACMGSGIRVPTAVSGIKRGFPSGRVARRDLKWRLYLCWSILTRRYLLAPNGYVL